MACSAWRYGKVPPQESGPDGLACGCGRGGHGQQKASPTEEGKAKARAVRVAKMRAGRLAAAAGNRALQTLVSRHYTGAVN